MVYVWFSFSIDFLDAIRYIAQNIPAPIPERIPNNGIEFKPSSKMPVIKKQPKRAKIIQINFLNVIFSPNNRYANINTKIGASERSTAARDNGTVFIDSL